MRHSLGLPDLRALALAGGLVEHQHEHLPCRFGQNELTVIIIRCILFVAKEERLWAHMHRHDESRTHVTAVDGLGHLSFYRPRPKDPSLH